MGRAMCGAGRGTGVVSGMRFMAEGGVPVLEPAVRAFLAELARDGGSPLDAPDLAGARAALARLQAVPVEAPTVHAEEIAVPTGPGGVVAVRLLRPVARNGRPTPFVLYLHGGGWVMGDAQTHDRLMRELAAGSGAVVAHVGYTLAPEAAFPVQIEQAYAVLCHLAAEAAAHGLDASRIAVAGDCAGGAMAASVAMLAKRRRGPELAFQLLLTPILGAPEPQGEAAPWLPAAAVCRYLDAAFPDAASRDRPIALPLAAAPEDLNDLPPALVITAEADVLCAQGEAYARRLAAAGVEVAATRHLGTIHDFMVLNPLARSAATRGAVAQASAALRHALYGS